jgi:hypothetical protein
MTELLVRRFIDRLEVTPSPKTTSLVGDAAPAPEAGFDPLILLVNAYLEAQPSAGRSFALAAAAVMGSWMFPWCAAETLAHGRTHAEFATHANAVLMGAISKTGKR